MVITLLRTLKIPGLKSRLGNRLYTGRFLWFSSVSPVDTDTVGRLKSGPTASLHILSNSLVSNHIIQSFLGY